MHMYDFHDLKMIKGLNKVQISKCPLCEIIQFVLFIIEYIVETEKCIT